MHEGVLPVVEPTVPLQVPPDRQALQVQLLLQVLLRRTSAVWAYSQAQGVQAHKDAYLFLLRQELHPGNIMYIYFYLISVTF